MKVLETLCPHSCRLNLDVRLDTSPESPCGNNIVLFWRQPVWSLDPVTRKENCDD